MEDDKLILVSREKLAKAFDMWAAEYPEVTKHYGLEDYGKNCAEHIIELLRKIEDMV